MRAPRKFGGRRALRANAQGREVDAYARDEELKEPLRFGQALEYVCTEIPEGHADRRQISECSMRRVREEHLPAMASSADSGGAVDVEA
jgi:hypothetical protein